MTKFKQLPWLRITLFALYFLISVATFRHSAVGFASIEGHIAWGMLSALAIDAGMILAAIGLRKTRNKWYLVGLVISAVASTYTQLLYSMAHSQTVTVAPGAVWMQSAALVIINLRIVVLPALLPGLAIVYSLVAEMDVQQDMQSWRELVERWKASNAKPGQIAMAVKMSANGDAPPVGELADAIGCAATTVSRAYEKLEE